MSFTPVFYEALTVSSEIVTLTAAKYAPTTGDRAGQKAQAVFLSPETDAVRYMVTPGTEVEDEAVGTGNDVLDTFDLDHSMVIPSTLVVTVAGVETAVTLSVGTGIGGVDQIVFASPPAQDAAIVASYSYMPGGMILAAGNTYLLPFGPTGIEQFKAVKVTGDATLHVTYLFGPIPEDITIPAKLW